MKYFLIAVAAFVFTFSFIQFLAGAVGCQTILNYGHADGDMIFLSTLIGLLTALVATGISHIEDM